MTEIQKLREALENCRGTLELARGSLGIDQSVACEAIDDSILMIDSNLETRPSLPDEEAKHGKTV